MSFKIDLLPPDWVIERCELKTTRFVTRLTDGGSDEQNGPDDEDPPRGPGPPRKRTAQSIASL